MSSPTQPVGSVDEGHLELKKLEMHLDAQRGKRSDASNRSNGEVGRGALPAAHDGEEDAASAAGAGAGGSGAAGSSQAQKKATTKAERRAKQEQERAAKAAKKAAEGGGQPTKGKAAGKPAVQRQLDITVDATKQRKQQVVERTGVQKVVELFAHLPQYEHEKGISLSAAYAGQIHPAVAKLGLQYAEGTVRGANARCEAMLSAFKAFIADYKTPLGATKALNRDLEAKLRPQIQYLVDCRPVSIGMGNAIKWLKGRITKLPAHLGEEEAKELLCEEIDGFANERISLATIRISEVGASTIQDGDVVVTCAAQQGHERARGPHPRRTLPTAQVRRGESRGGNPEGRVFRGR